MQELIAALAKAQAEMKHAVFDSKNPHFKSRYASLASVIDAVRGPLTRHGIAYVQRVTTTPDAVGVETVLLGHGAQIETGTVLVPLSAPTAHALGSALTYAKRYSLAAACGISADEDDDGNAATQQSQSAPEPTLTEGQVEELRNALFAAGRDHQLDQLLKAQRVSRIEDIQQARLPALLKRLRDLAAQEVKQ